MGTKLIGLIGRKRVGKDTVAARLVEAHGFTRYAFADNVRAAALALDPIVGESEDYDADVGMWTYPGLRLSELVEVDGWELAKAHPEVRRVLQHFGSEVIRKLDEEFWVRPVVAAIEQSGTPAVVTDVRFPNEAAAIERLGGRLVRVTRPGLDESDNHVSETALLGYPVWSAIINSSTVDVLHKDVDKLSELL
ncbi:hypothetical protein AB0H43_03085 [Hamadaea sp. NPDC050747]|uniref:deoxynucleotide monophosphate kinase family protein n=1 Tax=Hamadaea sp. NPDC050747 TaxID=3155789 RepID=UPI0033F74030